VGRDGKAVLVRAEPVKETFNGETVWEGTAVLHLGRIRSPLDAVRAAIVAERIGAGGSH
jgi:hypothetical protein